MKTDAEFIATMPPSTATTNNVGYKDLMNVTETNRVPFLNKARDAIKSLTKPKSTNTETTEIRREGGISLGAPAEWHDMYNSSS
ncbi:UNVERIFIED_CONTAM: hypothetical protein HDU68_007231 [Siphonaria sp. JEL0065]|nr:hypothetical protein HDU68_007231 [Siphonaria sp. JEL0065]